MVELAVHNLKGKEIEKLTVKDEIFARTPHTAVLHEYVKMYLNNQRQGTASALTRGQVRGGGKKPFAQKHTGRARAGSVRSPLWRGGGVIFGPSPRDYYYSLPKKKKRIAFYSALSSLREEGKIKVLEKLELKEGKTKELEKILHSLKIENKAILVIDRIPESVKKAASNIEWLKLRDPLTLNPYEILCADWLVFTKDALHKIEEVRI